MKSNVLRMILLLPAFVTYFMINAGELRIMPFQVEIGRIVTVPVECESTESYTGFQTRISLPDGLSFAPQEGEYTLPDPAISETHKIYSYLNGNTLNIVCFSESNAPLELSGTLFSVRIKVALDFFSGEIRITDTLFSTADHEDVNFPDTETDVAVEDTYVRPVESGIGRVTYEGDAVVVRIDSANDSWISLCDMHGKVVATDRIIDRQPSVIRFRRNTFTPGVYILNLVSAAGCRAMKIIL